MTITADTYELVTDPDTGENAIKITGSDGKIKVAARSSIHSVVVGRPPRVEYRDMGLSYVQMAVGDGVFNFHVADNDVNGIIAYLFGISEHFYTAIRILDVPDGNNQYAFISTNRDTRVVDKREVAGWEFKNTTTDGIHNLCITLKTGHTILIVLGILEYQAWESAHLGRFSYRYVNYDGTVTDDPVYPPEPPADDS